MYQSIATIDSPEFLNLEPMDINPLMSKCEIKVLYTGKNRNRSVITKDVATEMAKTLRGAPIVGYYREDGEDFQDHGRKVIIDEDGEVKFQKATRPYGFVAPDADVWFQNFEEEDESGQAVIREYLMTTGYLWTERYPECKSIVDEGKPQSMELDDKTLSGTWSYDRNSNVDFFIINDAIFSSLCILGDDVEPCFEGASIKEQEISKDFTKVDENFTQTLFTMMKDLQKIIKEGGSKMDENKNVQVDFETQNDTDVKEVDTESKPVPEDFSKEDEEKKKTDCALDKEEDKKKKDDSEEEEDKKAEDKPKEKEDKEKKDKYELLEEEYNAIKSQYEELQTSFNLIKKENEKLTSFKREIEDEKKDELINSFYMLSEEDKKDVIENKANYSLDDIKAKLSIICVDKRVSFDKEEEINQVDPISTFNLDTTDEEDVPAYIKAMRDIRREKE